MPSLIDIRRRVRAVKSTQQITKAMKMVSASKLRRSQERIVNARPFAQFGSDLDKSTQQQLNRGARLVEILKQGQYSPLPVAQQVVIIYAGTNGFLDPVPVASVGKYQAALATFMETKRPGILQAIAEKKTLDEALKAEMNTTLTEFGKTFAGAPAAA